MQKSYSKYPRIKKIHQMLEKITRFDLKRPKSIVSCYHRNLQKYILYILGQIQISKNYQNPTSTSKDTCKTIFIILFKLFSIGNSFKLEATQETRLI